MHIVVSWDIQAEPPRWKEIDDQLGAVIRPYRCARPLETFYVVNVGSEADRAAIIDALQAVGRAAVEKVNIVVSPAMVGGQYDGWLPENRWARISQTNPAAQSGSIALPAPELDLGAPQHHDRTMPLLGVWPQLGHGLLGRLLSWWSR